MVTTFFIHFTWFTPQYHLSQLFLNPLSEESTAESDPDGLDLCIVGQGILAKLTANTGLLEATEGHLVAEHVVGVDPDGTSLERVGDTEGGVQVRCVHCGGETIDGLVAGLDNLLLGLEFADGADGAEDLFLHDLHVLADIGEDGRLDEVALVAVTVSAGLDLGASLFAGLDIVHDPVKLELADLRTLECVGLEWVTDDVLRRSFLEGLDEIVVDAGLDVDTRAGAAALAVVEKDTEVDPGDSIFDVGVVEDNVGRLAAEF